MSLTYYSAAILTDPEIAQNVPKQPQIWTEKQSARSFLQYYFTGGRKWKNQEAKVIESSSVKK